MTVKELFNFVTDPLINDDNIEEYLTRAQEICSQRTEDEITQQERNDEEVFKNAYIPQRLDDVIDFEKDARKAKQGDVEDVYYPSVTGLNKELTGVKKQPDILASDLVHETDESSARHSDTEDENEQDDIDEENEDEEIVDNRTKKELRKG